MSAGLKHVKEFTVAGKQSAVLKNFVVCILFEQANNCNYSVFFMNYCLLIMSIRPTDFF